MAHLLDQLQVVWYPSQGMSSPSLPAPRQVLQPLDRKRLYQQVLEQLRTFVTHARLQPGDRLPSERELASQLGVSRSSVKQALTVLEVQGLVQTRQGGGTYLRVSTLASEELDVLLDRRQRLPDILDAREAIEIKLAALAAERRTEADLEAMRGALEAMRVSVADSVSAEDGDRAFHAAMAESGHSKILLDFYLQLAPQIAEVRRESLRQVGRPAKSLLQHERILRAISERDPSQAVLAVRRHLRTVARNRLMEWDPDSSV